MFFFLMLYIGLFLEGVFKTGSTEKCAPAEEDKAHSILGRFYHELEEKLEIVVKKNSSAPVSTCRNNLSCHDRDTSTTTTVTSLGNKEFAVNFTLESMSRTDSCLWEIKYLGLASLIKSSPLFSCELKSFVKAKNVSCMESFENNDMLKINCIVYGIYPKARGLLLSRSSKSAIIMSCTHSLTDTTPVYYVSLCQVLVAVRDMPSISDSPFVSIYPNVTGKDEDIKYSVNFTLRDYRAQPVLVLQNCSEFVEEWVQVQCLCRPRDISAMQTNVSWSTNSDITFSTSSNWLHFQAQIKHTEFVCRGRSLAGVNSEPVLYRPTVYSSVKNITCSVEKINSDFVIKCYIYKVYPPAICNMLTDNEHLTDELTAKNTSHVQLSNDVYYNTECTWKLSISNLNYGQNIVTVKVYPNISGTDRDKDYVLSKILYLIRPSDSTQEGRLVPQEYIGPISIAAASLLILLFAALLFIIVVRRKNLLFRHPPETSRRPEQKELVGSDALQNSDDLYWTIEETILTEATFDEHYVNSKEITKQISTTSKLLNTEYITPTDVHTSQKNRNTSDESDGYFSQEESPTPKH